MEASSFQEFQQTKVAFWLSINSGVELRALMRELILIKFSVYSREHEGRKRERRNDRKNPVGEPGIKLR